MTVYLVMQTGEDVECFASREAAIAFARGLLSDDWMIADFDDELRLEAFQQGRRDYAEVFFDNDGEKVRLEACQVKH